MIVDRHLYFQMKILFSEGFWVICYLFPSAGDETQVNLAIVQASCKDSGVYGCTITNEYGTDSTDCLLSADSMYSFTLNLPCNKHFSLH